MPKIDLVVLRDPLKDNASHIYFPFPRIIFDTVEIPAFIAKKIKKQILLIHFHLNLKIKDKSLICITNWLEIRQQGFRCTKWALKRPLQSPESLWKSIKHCVFVGREAGVHHFPGSNNQVCLTPWLHKPDGIPIWEDNLLTQRHKI